MIQYQLIHVDHPTGRPNFTLVAVNGVYYYFSYKTLIAVYDRDLIISENNWSPTTGKHLNYLSTDKKIRLPYEEFQEKVAAHFGEIEQALYLVKAGHLPPDPDVLAKSIKRLKSIERQLKKKVV